MVLQKRSLAGQELQSFQEELRADGLPRVEVRRNVMDPRGHLIGPGCHDARSFF